MSGLTPVALAEFRRSLRVRGLNMETLADLVGCERPFLSLVVNGHFTGRRWWAKIRACVTDQEWALLLQLPHCAAWNRQALAHGPKALIWTMRRVCAGTGNGCGEEMGFVACVASQAGKVTSTLCPKCYAAYMAELDAHEPKEMEIAAL